MKVIKQSVDILSQEPGVVGMYKHMEICGRVSWKSESRITEDSYKKFIKFLYQRGHWAVFNLGTVYLKLSIGEREYFKELLEDNPWVKWTEDEDFIYLTTNFRVLCQLKLTDLVDKYWCDPIPGKHHFRITAHWITSRGIGEEILRHRVFSFVKESTRYINYSQEQRGGEIQYILPQYAYTRRDEIAATIDSLTGEDRSWIKDLDGEELWRNLTVLDRWAAGRDNLWRSAEEEYRAETLEDEVAPEVARGCLPLDVRGEFYCSGWIRDFYYEPPIETPEKAGFFKLRTASDCHQDLRPLAIELKRQMDEKGYDKLWNI